MYLLTLRNRKTEGAYAVQDAKGDKVLFLFEDEDDAERYAMQLEEQEDNEMDVVEVDSDLAIKTCKLYNCLLYTSPSPRDRQKSRMPSSA